MSSSKINLKTYRKIQWLMMASVLIVSTVAWWQVRSPFDDLTIYEVFPLFGAVGFGVMWTHFVSGSMRRFWSLDEKSVLYRDVSMGIVLTCILAHPIIVWAALYFDGGGFPPQSHLNAYGGSTALDLALVLGFLGLVVFILFEMRNTIKNKKIWHMIGHLQVPAMLGIFYHGLTLGGEMSLAWFRALWWFYGLTFVASCVYNYYKDYRRGISNGGKIIKS